MKKLLFLAVILLCSAKAHSVNFPPWNKIPSSQDNDLRRSTAIAGETLNPIISTYSAVVYGLLISSPGGAGAGVEVFDSKVTTSGIAGQSLFGRIDATVVRTWIGLNVFCSSGITLSNSGPIPGATVLLYRPR